jgi:hypothetical protein
MTADTSAERRLSPRTLAALTGLPLLGFAAALWWVVPGHIPTNTEKTREPAVLGRASSKLASGQRVPAFEYRDAPRLQSLETSSTVRPIAPAVRFAAEQPQIVYEAATAHDVAEGAPVTFEDLASHWEQEIERNQDRAWSESVRSFVSSALATDGGKPSLVDVECATTICRLELTVRDLGVLSPLQAAVSDDGHDGRAVRLNVTKADGGVTVEVFMTSGDAKDPAAQAK